MERCKHQNRTLAALLAAGSSADELAAAHQHLERCSQCRQALQMAVWIASNEQDEVEPAVPPGLRGAILSATVDGRRRRAVHRRIALAGACGACAAALTLVVAHKPGSAWLDASFISRPHPMIALWRRLTQPAVQASVASAEPAAAPVVRPVSATAFAEQPVRSTVERTELADVREAPTRARRPAVSYAVLRWPTTATLSADPVEPAALRTVATAQPAAERRADTEPQAMLTDDEWLESDEMPSEPRATAAPVVVLSAAQSSGLADGVVATLASIRSSRAAMEPLPDTWETGHDGRREATVSLVRSRF
ncbi:MAG: hypothetical protein NT029_15105 [Armatimonadetes bacterium]|nr:hypothetical protein [Armatimonadota bacterium]